VWGYGSSGRTFSFEPTTTTTCTVASLRSRVEAIFPVNFFNLGEPRGAACLSRHGFSPFLRDRRSGGDRAPASLSVEGPARTHARRPTTTVADAARRIIAKAVREASGRRRRRACTHTHASTHPNAAGKRSTQERSSRLSRRKKKRSDGSQRLPPFDQR